MKGHESSKRTSYKAEEREKLGEPVGDVPSPVDNTGLE